MEEKTRDTSTKSTTTLTSQDIADAYVYLLGRELVLKQERLDFEKERFEWNQLVYREPGGVAWANPNLDVVYSEAWVALDENTCVLLEIPEIKDRYYTWHMLNGWGETLLNINERTYPQQAFGKYALCLKGSNPKIPEGALRIDVPTRVSRVLARVELGKKPEEAIHFQHLFRLTPQGDPKIENPIVVPVFEGMDLPGAEIFNNAIAKMNSETDINSGMDALQSKVKQVEELFRSGDDGKKQIDDAIKNTAIPSILDKIQHIGVEGNGWTHPISGNYGSNYLLRTAVNLAGIWANNAKEATYFAKVDLDGSATYSLTFPKDALPDKKATYFWSVIATDSKKFQVLQNPLKRYLLNNQSDLKYNADGSLTLVFGPKQSEKYPEGNWLPTLDGVQYNLTMRFYGPSGDVSGGQYFPPPLVKEGQ